MACYLEPRVPWVRHETGLENGRGPFLDRFGYITEVVLRAHLPLVWLRRLRTVFGVGHHEGFMHCVVRSGKPRARLRVRTKIVLAEMTAPSNLIPINSLLMVRDLENLLDRVILGSPGLLRAGRGRDGELDCSGRRRCDYTFNAKQTIYPKRMR